MRSSRCGAKVRERVPDWVVRKANQIELVDSSPEELRRRRRVRHRGPPHRPPRHASAEPADSLTRSPAVPPPRAGAPPAPWPKWA